MKRKFGSVKAVSRYLSEYRLERGKESVLTAGRHFYFDHKVFRILVMTCFVFGIPLAIGIVARVIGWSVNQVRDCYKILDDSASINCI